MVSGIGTALFYSAFLPWASVCVNTGWKDCRRWGCSCGSQHWGREPEEVVQVLLDVDSVKKTRNKINKETVGVVWYVLGCSSKTAVMSCYVNVRISEDSSSIKFMILSFFWSSSAALGWCFRADLWWRHPQHVQSSHAISVHAIGEGQKRCHPLGHWEWNSQGCCFLPNWKGPIGLVRFGWIPVGVQIVDSIRTLAGSMCPRLWLQRAKCHPSTRILDWCICANLSKGGGSAIHEGLQVFFDVLYLRFVVPCVCVGIY